MALVAFRLVLANQVAPGVIFITEVAVVANAVLLPFRFHLVFGRKLAVAQHVEGDVLQILANGFRPLHHRAGLDVLFEQSVAGGIETVALIRASRLDRADQSPRLVVAVRVRPFCALDANELIRRVVVMRAFERSRVIHHRVVRVRLRVHLRQP